MLLPHGLPSKLKHLLGLSNVGFVLCYGKTAIRYVHSPHQFRVRKPFSPSYRFRKGCVKLSEKENAGPKVYMREIIGKISNLLRFSSWDSAKEQLEGLSVKWDSFTINQVLKTHPPMEKAWLFFNWASRLKGFKHDQFTYTTMLDIFGEARRISSMKYVFEQMQEKGIKVDAITYTSMFHWLSNDGDFDGAVRMWEEMKAKGCYPTVVSYTAYMKILFDHKRVKEAIEVYKELLQSGCSPNCHTYTVLMEHLVDSGKFEAALGIFSRMQESGVQPDKATCNILVEKCSKAGASSAVIQVLSYMKENRLVLRHPVYLQAHEALKKAGVSDLLLLQVNPHISIQDTSASDIIESVDAAQDPNCVMDSGLLLIFLRKRNFLAVDCLLTGLTNENVKVEPWLISTVIVESCANDKAISALLAFDYGVKTSIDIGTDAFLALIGSLIRRFKFPEAVKVVEEMAQTGNFLEADSASLLIYRLGCSQQLDFAEKTFDILPDELKTCVTFTAFIAACFSAGNPDRGIEAYETMRRVGIQTATATYDVLIYGLEKIGRLDEAKFYLKEKKSWLRGSQSSEIAATEQRLCNLLFAVDVVP
ncbi:hypothetical protein Dimus_017059 [Dionaea muscipula]